MQKIWNILWKSLSKYNLTDSAFALTVIYRARKHMVDFFWDNVLKNADAEKFQNSILYVKCNSAVWAQQIQLSSQDLLELIKNDFPDKSFFNIKVYH